MPLENFEPINPNAAPQPQTVQTILGAFGKTVGSSSAPAQQGYVPPSNQDIEAAEYRFLRGKGYSGNIADMRNSYYAALLEGSVQGLPGVQFLHSGYGVVDNAGVLSSTAAFQNFAAYLATKPGSVGFVPPGVYRVSNVNFTESVNLILDGVIFIQATNNSIFRFTGGYETPITVTTVDTVSTFDGGGTWPHGRLTLATNPVGWAQGDIVKLYSFDKIPEARPGDPGEQKSLGEFAIVMSVATNVVVLSGPLRETGATYATNVRVAKLKNTRVTLSVWQSYTEQANLVTYTAAQLSFTSIVEPTIDHVNISAGGGIGVSYKDCFGGGIRGGSISHLMNNTGAGQFGYAVQDNGCDGLNLVNLTVTDVRHAYTDESSWSTEATTDPSFFGRSRGVVLNNWTAYGTKGGAFDFHSSGEGGTVVNCRAFSCAVGFQARGKKHRFINAYARGCTMSAWVFNEPDYPAQDMSWGHEFINPDFDNCSTGLMTESQTRFSRLMVTVKGGRIAARSNPVVGTSGHMKLCGGVEITGSAANSAQLAMINMTNCRLFVDGIRFKPRPFGTTGSTIRFVRLNDAECDMYGRDVEFFLYQMSGRITTGILGTSGNLAEVKLLDVRSDEAFGNAVTVTVAGTSSVTHTVGVAWDNDMF